VPFMGGRPPSGGGRRLVTLRHRVALQRHSSARRDNAIMNSKATLWFAGLLLVVSVNSSLGDPSQQDTTVPNRFEFSSAEYVIAENATNAVITVLFYPGNRSMTGSAGFRTEDGTAVAGEDYLHVEGILSFSGGAPRSFSVPIIWDKLDEGDQTVLLRLGGGASQSTATLRIMNVPSPVRPQREGGAVGPAKKRPPPIVTLNVAERTAVEGGDRVAALAVRRSHGIENPLRVYYRVTGSARNGADYDKLEGAVVIPAGSHEAAIEIIPLDDGLREGVERVAVQLKPAPRKYRLGAAHRRVIEILDNDQP
jgi:hypothetical protein